MKLELHPEDLPRLYGSLLYVIPDKSSEAARPKLVEAAPEVQAKPAPLAPEPKAEVPGPEPDPPHTLQAPATKEQAAKPAQLRQAPTPPETRQAPSPPKTLHSQPASRPQAAPSPVRWRLKENSRVLFILHKEEMKDKALTALLKKIVASIELPFEAAGFGTITGPYSPPDLAPLPHEYAVVFDDRFADMQDPLQLDGGIVYFSHQLGTLTDNRGYKKALWEKLKQIRSKLD